MRLLPSAFAALVGSLLAAAPARAQEFAEPPRAAVALPSPPPGPALAVATSAPEDRRVPSVGARSGDALTIAIASAAAGFAAADLGFGIHDTVKVANGVQPARGVAIAEASVAAPQVLVLGTLIATLSPHDDGRNGLPMAALVLLPGAANSMFVHGVWGAESTTARPGVLYGVSAAVGFDAALLTSILGRASEAHFSNRGMGIMQMVLTAPQIAASAYGVARDSGNARGWAALAGGSGALFAHGLVSSIVGGPPPEAPISPPMPPSPPRPPLLVPASIEAAPMPVAGGFGLGVRGAWL